MSWRLNHTDLETRLKAHTALNYHSIYNVMKALTLANGAFTLARFIEMPAFPFDRLPLLLASFLSLILTFDAAHVGIIVINWMPSWKDIVLPFAIAISEFLLFTVLRSAEDIRAWHIVFAAFAFLCHLLLWNIITNLQPRNYETTLHRLLDRYRRSMQRDRLMSGIHGVIWICVAVLFYSLPVEKFQWLAGILACGIMVRAIANQESDRAWIADFIRVSQ